MPSENVLRLKELLRDGWKINTHHFSFIADTNEEKVHLVLEKEGKKTYMEATNDGEFTEYTFHFKKFEDNYGNYEFIYIPDLKEYNQRTEELSKKGIVPKRPFEISIGDILLKDAHLDHLLIAGPGGPHFSVASFFLFFDKNPAFHQVDFHDDVVIKWIDNGEVAFTGFAHEVSCTEKSASILCYGGTRRFFQKRLTSELVAIQPEDSLYFLTTQSGMIPRFHGPKKPELSQRIFKVIFPIGGIIIPSNFKIEQVVFTKDISKDLSEKIRISNTFSKAPWVASSTFAVIDIEATHYFEALVKAEENIKRAIDWIQFRTDITFPSIKENNTQKMLSYNLNKSFSKCFLIRYGLAIDSKTGGALFLLLNEQSGHELVFNYNPNYFFEPLIPIWEKLEQLWKENNVSIQPIYEALNWLMQSFEVESPTENLLQLWMAFEFICSGQRVPKSIRDSSINTSISCIRTLKLPQIEEEAIIKCIQQVNNPVLMVKWEHLLVKLGILLSARENQLISKLRKERNNIIHGKKTSKLSTEDIERFRSILEKVFLTKVIQLINFNYGIPNLEKLFNENIK